MGSGVVRGPQDSRHSAGWAAQVLQVQAAEVQSQPLLENQGFVSHLGVSVLMG